MIRFNNKRDGLAIARAAGTRFDAAVDVVIGHLERGELTGGVVYKGWTGSSIHLHVAGFGPGWLNRDLLWVCFHYAFEQLNCRLILGAVPTCNHKHLEFFSKVGFKEVARIPEVFPSGAGAILTMQRADCRWLNLKPRTIAQGTTGV